MSGTDFVSPASDPYARRIVWGVYGPPGVGKTELLLKIAREQQDHHVRLLSMDRGTKRMSLEPYLYGDRIKAAFPSSLQDTRELLKKLNDTIPKAVEKHGPERIWVAIDTGTHMQIRFMAEARRLQIGRRDTTLMGVDEVLREAITQVDYSINIAQMSEISDLAMQLPCNLVYTFLGKRTEKGSIVPAVSGQAGERLKGDCDVLAFMEIDPDDPKGKNRRMRCHPHVDFEAKDRTGRLDAVELPDLVVLNRKILGMSGEKKE